MTRGKLTALHSGAREIAHTAFGCGLMSAISCASMNGEAYGPSTTIRGLILSSVVVCCIPAVPPLAAQGRPVPGIRVARTDLTTGLFNLPHK